MAERLASAYCLGVRRRAVYLYCPCVYGSCVRECIISLSPLLAACFFDSDAFNLARGRCAVRVL